jgi:membrane-bound serine protease (ClpP class)
MTLLGTALALLTSMNAPAAAQGEPAPGPSVQGTAPSRHVDVIEVSGVMDPVQVDFVARVVAAAEREEAEAVVVQLDSPHSAVDRSRVDDLVRRVGQARVPVAVWVGPSGGRAIGAAYRLLQVAGVNGVAPGTKVGGSGVGVMSGSTAVQRGVVDVSAPTLGDFIVELDGRTVAGRNLETSEVVTRPGQLPRRQPTVEVRFAKPGLAARMMHATVSPSVAYILLVGALALVILELYTGGIGIASAAGAACLVLSAYGLAVLPTRPIALALVGLSAFGFAVDVQAGVPRFWTVVGSVALVAGSLTLYGEGLSPSIIALMAVIVGMVLLMVGGLPSMVRARFSTPTIGRESMVGEMGQALADVAPEGTVEIRGARWRARTNRATPIPAGQPVRVVGIDGLLLEVEPESGGARDHRQRPSSTPNSGN